MTPILAGILSAVVATAVPPSGNYKTIIDGKTYRVKVKGGAVGVFDKSLISMRSPERGDLMRKALKQATGCGIRDEYWEGAHLVGMLDCPETSIPPVD